MTDREWVPGYNWEPGYGFCADNTTDLDQLVRTVEHVRRLACQNNHSSGQRDQICDCKYGLGRDLLAGKTPAAADRRHRPSEEATGCPELRELIHRLLHRPASLLPDDQETHVIEFRDDGWTIKHPLACRPALFECRINRLAEQGLGYTERRGQYELTVNEDLGGTLVVGEQVDGGDRP